MKEKFEPQRPLETSVVSSVEHQHVLNVIGKHMCCFPADCNIFDETIATAISADQSVDRLALHPSGQRQEGQHRQHSNPYSSLRKKERKPGCRPFCQVQFRWRLFAEFEEKLNSS
eukprot:GHVO01031646.1.p1 GENE.GHVO01031646.1~~GHVO01031646.1.p1  ORF type:complete len:115 (-),score=11.19 GHVO01031646.1:897-1241(-)